MRFRLVLFVCQIQAVGSSNSPRRKEAGLACFITTNHDSPIPEITMKILLAAFLALASTPSFAAESFAFKVEISLSPKAAAKLAQLHEGITGAAYYYGWPTPAARKNADDVGQINLNFENVMVEDTAKTIQFTGKVVKRKEIAWLVKRQVRVAVNVYSARRSSPDNILNCDIYDGPVAEAVAKTPKITCKLIESE